MSKNRKGFWTFPVSLLIISITMICLSAYIPTCVAQGPEEIAYDDDGYESNRGYEPGWYQSVKFSLPTGCSQVRLITARFYIFIGDNNFIVHVLGSDGNTELITPFETAPGHKTEEWYEVDLTPKDIRVMEDFYIAVEYLHNDPYLGYDTTEPDGRSFFGKPGSWTPFSDGDLMIRAVVRAQIPVGGEIIPVNTSALLAAVLQNSLPYIALVVVATAVAVLAAHVHADTINVNAK